LHHAFYFSASFFEIKTTLSILKKRKKKKKKDDAKAFNPNKVILMHIATVDPNMYMEDTASLSPVTSNPYFIKINSMDELPTIIPLLMAFLCEYSNGKTSFIYISIGTVPQIS
jgi:hypothetical protein